MQDLRKSTNMSKYLKTTKSLRNPVVSTPLNSTPLNGSQEIRHVMLRCDQNAVSSSAITMKTSEQVL